MKSVWILVGLEVALFAFAISVYIYELTLGAGNEPDTYRATRFYRTIIALFLILLAWDNRRIYKGYLILFTMLLISGIVVALDATLYLPTTNMTAYSLNVASAWAHVTLDVIVLVWYTWMIFQKGKKENNYQLMKR